MSAEIIKLVTGRARLKAALPKPVECKECGEPIETARLQSCAGDIMRCVHCISCAKLWERRFENQMRGVREHQAVEVIR